jgi:ABC-2 type transport system permease protein
MTTTLTPVGSHREWDQHRPATRTKTSDLKAVPSALRSEWRKVASVRTYKAILALNAVGGALVSWAVARFTTDQPMYVSEVGFYWTVISAILAAVVGILMFTSEGQHGTLPVTLTAQPARWVIAASKAAMAAATGAVIGAVGIAAGFGGAAIAGIEMGNTSSVAAMTLWALLYTGLSAVLGLGTGMVIRHSAGAVTGILVWGFVIEGLLAFVVPARTARFLPFLAGDRLLALELSLDTPEKVAVALTQPQAALVFGGYALMALTIGTLLLSRRDAA